MGGWGEETKKKEGLERPPRLVETGKPVAGEKTNQLFWICIPRPHSPQEPQEKNSGITTSSPSAYNSFVFCKMGSIRRSKTKRRTR